MLIALSLFAAEPVAIEVTGMDPQIARAEQTASAEGWTKTCTGTAGEETVLRFSLPAGWTEARLVQALGGERRYVSSYHIVWAGEEIPATCDQEPGTSSGEHNSLLAFGPAASLSPLVKIAQSCGFRDAFIRDMKKEDILDETMTVPPDFKVLDADEDITPRPGPSICYLQMMSQRR